MSDHGLIKPILWNLFVNENLYQSMPLAYLMVFKKLFECPQSNVLPSNSRSWSAYETPAADLLPSCKQESPEMCMTTFLRSSNVIFSLIFIIIFCNWVIGNHCFRIKDCFRCFCCQWFYFINDFISAYGTQSMTLRKTFQLKWITASMKNLEFHVACRLLTDGNITAPGRKWNSLAQ